MPTRDAFFLFQWVLFMENAYKTDQGVKSNGHGKKEQNEQKDGKRTENTSRTDKRTEKEREGGEGNRKRTAGRWAVRPVKVL